MPNRFNFLLVTRFHMCATDRLLRKEIREQRHKGGVGWQWLLAFLYKILQQQN